MSTALARQLVRYRNALVAIANAGITWIILIIAPLGLFAVILCTVAVFASSLVIGLLGDWAFVSLLKAGRTDVLRSHPFSSPEAVAPTANPDNADAALHQDTRRSLPEND